MEYTSFCSTLQIHVWVDGMGGKGTVEYGISGKPTFTLDSVD